PTCCVRRRSACAAIAFAMGDAPRRAHAARFRRHDLLGAAIYHPLTAVHDAGPADGTSRMDRRGACAWSLYPCYGWPAAGKLRAVPVDELTRLSRLRREHGVASRHPVNGSQYHLEPDRLCRAVSSVAKGATKLGFRRA